MCKGYLPYGPNVLDNFDVTALFSECTAPEDLVPEEDNPSFSHQGAALRPLFFVVQDWEKREGRH